MSKFKKFLPLAFGFLGAVAFFGSFNFAQAEDVCGQSVSGYSTAIVNNQCWTTQNLAIKNPLLGANLTVITYGTGCHYPTDANAFCASKADGYGLENDDYAYVNGNYLYAYGAAKNVCSKLGEGWRLPTNDEWWDLAGLDTASKKNCTGSAGSNSSCEAYTHNNCEYTFGNGGNLSTLNINQAGGYYYIAADNNDYYVYQNINGTFDVFWSSDGKYSSNPGDDGVYWGFYFLNNSNGYVLRQGIGIGREMASVRCVRDLQAPVINTLEEVDTTVGGVNDNDKQVTLKVETTSDSSANLTYYLYGKNKIQATNTTHILSGNITFTLNSLSDLDSGENVWQIYADDGRPSNNIFVKIVKSTVYTPIAPTVSSADDTTDDPTPTWTWTSGSTHGDKVFDYKLVKSSGATVTAGSVSGQYTFTSVNLEPDTYTFSVRERFNADPINGWSDYGTKTVKVVDSLNPDVAASPNSGDYSDKTMGVTLTAYKDENKTEESSAEIKYKIGGAANWTTYTKGAKVKVLEGAAVGNSVTLSVKVGDATDRSFTYKLVSAGTEDQTLNTHVQEEDVANVVKITLENADVNKLAKVKVDDTNKEEEIKLNLSKITTTASGKKTVTLTGDNEKLQIKRDSGISVEFDLRGTKLTADSAWTGEVIVPTVTDSPSNYGITSDEEIKTTFKIGDLNNKISVSKAVRIVIPNEGENMAMYFDKNIGSGQWREVPACSTLGIDTQDEANTALAEDGDCYAEEGGDMVIYTKHFSFFSTFISNVVKNSAVDDSSDSGYSISKGVLATVKKFTDMLGGASQRVTVASGLNLADVFTVTRDGKVVSIDDIIDTASGSAASRTNRLVSFAVGDTISTTSAGALDVDLGGFTKMHIAKNSKVTIKDAKNEQIIYSQGDGQIRYEFDKQDTDMSWEVRTKSVNAVIRGTIIDVLVANGEEIYDLIKGTIDIEDGHTGKTYSLVAGDRLKVDAKGNILIGKIGDDLSIATTSDETGRKYRRPVGFRDVPLNQWFTDAVMALKNSRIIKGYEGNYFKPSQAINRAEALKIILMATGQTIKSSVGSSQLMKDVKSGDWFANYVVTADEANIVSGYEDGTFRPDEPITRAEALKIILKAKGVTVSGGQSVSDYFLDVSANDWFASYVAYAYKNGIITGYSDGTFRPNAPVTRAEFAKMVSDSVATN